MNKNKKKTKAAKSIRKAYKQYGEYRAHQYLLLFYSYTEGVRKNDGKDENKGVSEYKTCFNHYVKKEYGQEFFNDYSLFYLANKENKKLLKKLYKYRSEFISRTIVTLNDEPIHNKAEKTKKETKIEEIKEIVTDVQAQILPINNEKKKQGTLIYCINIPQVNRKEPEYRTKEHCTPIQPYPIHYENKPKQKRIENFDLREEISQMTTSQLIFDSLPTRNIDYMPYKKPKHSYKFTMQRLSNNEIFTAYYPGFDMNEAMARANRLYFDSAKIISVEEEKKYDLIR